MFLLNRGELIDRFNPEFYVYKRTADSFSYSVKPLKSLLKVSPQYGANEIGVDRFDSKTPRYIRITDIDEFGQLIEEDLGKTTETIEAKYFLNDNDLLFARSGNTVGKAYLHKSSNVGYPCFFAGYMIRFVLNEDEILPEFVFYFTQTKFYRNWVNGNKRTAGQPNINAEEYKSLLIPIPPIDIQQQVVKKFEKAYAEKKVKEAEMQEKLSSVDSLVLDALGIILPERKENTLKSRTFFTTSSNISSGRFDAFYHLKSYAEKEKALHKGKFPVVRLNSVCRQITDGTHFTPNYQDEGVLFLSVKNVRRETLDLRAVKYISPKEHAELIKRCKPETGDVLLTKVGTIGLAAVVPDDVPEFSLFVSVALLKVKKDLLNPRYLSLFLNSTLTKFQAERAVKGVGVPDWHLENIRHLEIPLPPPEVQKEIAEQVEAIYAEAKLLREQGAEILKQAKAEVEKMILGEAV